MKKEIKYVFHIADIHIRNISRHAEYLEVFSKLIVEINNFIGKNDPEEYRIVIAGDLLHQKIQISNEQLIFTCELLNDLAKICQVVIIAGNHDLLENNKDRVDSITPIVRLLKNDKVNYLKESKCYQDLNIIWCVYSIFEENKRPNIEQGREVFGEDKTYIGLYHAPLNGAKTDIGYEFEHSDNVEIFKGLDFVMCGDIHLRQEIPFEVPVVYCGSTIQQNFGERLKGHGFVIWDVAARTYKGVDIPNDNVMLQFKIKSINDVDNNVEILTNE